MKYGLILCLIFWQGAPVLGQTQEDLIQGKWQVDIQATVNTMSSANRANYDSLNATMRQMITAHFNSREFLIRADASCRIQSYNYVGEVLDGTWSLTDDNLAMTFSESSLDFPILQLSKDKLVLQLDTDPKALFNELHLDLIER